MGKLWINGMTNDLNLNYMEKLTEKRARAGGWVAQEFERPI